MRFLAVAAFIAPASGLPEISQTCDGADACPDRVKAPSLLQMRTRDAARAGESLAEPCPNLARGKPVTCSWKGCSKALLGSVTDGVILTYDGYQGTGDRYSREDKEPPEALTVALPKDKCTGDDRPYVEIDLGEPVEFQQVYLWGFDKWDVDERDKGSFVVEQCCGRMVTASNDRKHWKVGIDFGEETFEGMYTYQWDEPPIDLEKPITGRYVRMYTGSCSANNGKPFSSFVEVQVIPTTCKKGSFEIEITDEIDDDFYFNWVPELRKRFPEEEGRDIDVSLCRKGDMVWQGTVDLSTLYAPKDGIKGDSRGSSSWGNDKAVSWQVGDILVAEKPCPDGGRRSAGNHGGSKGQTDCFVKNQMRKKHDGTDMNGQRRSHETSAENCQKRCQNTRGCAYFTWWSDGGCHLQCKGAKLEEVPTSWGTTVTGPAFCP